MDYPELKRALREQYQCFRPTNILIEDKASGTQLVQELIREGMYGVTRYEPSADKVMRLFAHPGRTEFLPKTKQSKLR